VNLPSGWSFTELSVVRVDSDAARRYNPKGMMQKMDGDVAIEFTLQRNRGFYMTVFYLPLLGNTSYLHFRFLPNSVLYFFDFKKDYL